MKIYRVFILLILMISMQTLVADDLGSALKVGIGYSDHSDEQFVLSLSYGRPLTGIIELLSDLDFAYTSDGYVPASLYLGPSFNIYSHSFISLDSGILLGISYLTDIKGVSSGVGFAAKFKNNLSFKVTETVELQFLADTVYYNIYSNHYYFSDLGLGLGFSF